MKDRIAVVGGTGSMGIGLAYRLAKAGYPVCIGSRDAARAAAAAEILAGRLDDAEVTGMSNQEASAISDIIIITVPYAHHATTIGEIRQGAQGKLVLDATVPLRPPKVGRVQLPAIGAAAMEAQELLGKDVDVVSAFQNVGAAHLNGDAAVDCDVLVSGNKVAARERVLALLESIGMRGWHAGLLPNSAAAEALTSVLIQINKHYRFPGAGIRITAGAHGAGSDSCAPDRLELIALRDLPRIKAGDDLVDIIVRACGQNNLSLLAGDVLVVTQKIVSKAEGRTVVLADVVPSKAAITLAQAVQKDPRVVELILQESSRVVRQVPGLLIVEHRLGFVMANAGVDQSNTESGTVVLLPENPDRSAEVLRQGIKAATGRTTGVIVSDSIGRAWRNGTVGHALGVAGLTPVLDLRGTTDLFERAMETTEVAVADEIAAAASLLTGQAAEGKPVVLVRGIGKITSGGGSGQLLLRDKFRDLFR